MKLPSIQQLVQDCHQTIIRFSIAMVVAWIGTVAALILADRTGPEQPTVFYKVLFASALGFPFLTGIILAGEKRGWRSFAAWGAQGAGLLIVLAYATTVPMNPFQGPEMFGIRFALLLVTALMFIAASPFFWKGEINGFWHYNKALLFRLVTTVLYSAVLFAGLAIALAALDQLFGVDVPSRRYFELWILVVGLFGTGFFLAGIPGDLRQLDRETDYPKSLKALSQYILLPLVLLYMIILYAYIGKIVGQWNWPKGWVSALILGFAATGISAFLLVYPIRDLAENLWIRKAWRWFYLIIIPLIPVLFLAASRRISQYGITEGRYILLTCGVWLALLALYFNLSRTRSIKFIPLSVGLMTLLISFGPWGAFSVSEKSQVNRLSALLTRNEILTNGRVQKAPSEVSPADASQISAIFDYLRERHGYESVQPWFAESLREDSSATDSKYKSAETVVGLIGVAYLRTWESGDMRWFNASLDAGRSISLAGYDRLIPSQGLPGSDSLHNFLDEGVSYRCSRALDTFTFRVMENGHAVDSLQLDLRQFADNLRNDRSAQREFKLPLDSLSISAEKEGLKVRVAFTYLNATLDDNKVSSVTGSADIFYSSNRLKK